MIVFLCLLTKYSRVARESPRCVMIDSIIFARPDSLCLLANPAFQKLCVASCAVRLLSRLTSEIHCCRASLLHDYWKLHEPDSLSCAWWWHLRSLKTPSWVNWCYFSVRKVFHLWGALASHSARRRSHLCGVGAGVMVEHCLVWISVAILLISKPKHFRGLLPYFINHCRTKFFITAVPHVCQTMYKCHFWVSYLNLAWGYELLMGTVSLSDFLLCMS